MRTKRVVQGRSIPSGTCTIPAVGGERLQSAGEPETLPPRMRRFALGSAAAVAFLLCFVAPPAHSQAWPDAPPPPEMVEDAPPPVLDERARELQMLEEADITLIERPDGIIREYRIAGRLFMVEVVPVIGPRYYLIDTTGDGMLDTRREGLGPDFVPPQWILFQW